MFSPEDAVNAAVNTRLSGKRRLRANPPGRTGDSDKIGRNESSKTSWP